MQVGKKKRSVLQEKLSRIELRERRGVASDWVSMPPGDSMPKFKTRGAYNRWKNKMGYVTLGRKTNNQGKEIRPTRIFAIKGANAVIAAARREIDGKAQSKAG